MTEAEKKFTAENGMSSAEAWNFVLQWKKEGKIQEAQNGCQEILRYFPDNQEAKMMLSKMEEDAREQQPVHHPKKKKGIPIPLQKMIDKATTPQEPLPGMETPEKEERFWGAFSYAYFLVLIPLLLKRDSQFVEFHALQGILLAIFTFVYFNIFVPFFSLLRTGAHYAFFWSNTDHLSFVFNAPSISWRVVSHSGSLGIYR
jgi:uncharacterized membrane protein